MHLPIPFAAPVFAALALAPVALPDILPAVFDIDAALTDKIDETADAPAADAAEDAADAAMLEAAGTSVWEEAAETSERGASCAVTDVKGMRRTRRMGLRREVERMVDDLMEGDGRLGD